METVSLDAFIHRNSECIGIFFTRNRILDKIICNLQGIKWSRTRKCWYMPLSKINYETLGRALKGKAIIDHAGLSRYLKAKKVGERETESVQATGIKNNHPPLRSISEVPAGQANPTGIAYYKGSRIHPVNAHVIPNMHEHLKLKAYSSSTIRTYLGEMKQLLGMLKNIPADELKVEHIKRYLLFCFEKLHVTENTLHSRINALKYYYEQVLGREKFFWEIPRPKKQLQLPNFFNPDEIAAILRAVDNVKHKTMLMLAYSSGLRVSEVVRIRTKDIDSKRMCILIKQAKGKKDRIVRLSPVLLIMLREYWKKYKPTRDGVLFQGQYAGEPYSTRSLQLILASAKQKAGILKPGSIHALRHSFATHLLDKGTDVTMIMKLLGHNDIKTTLRYLHVTNRDMLQIVSPLDDLKLD